MTEKEFNRKVIPFRNVMYGIALRMGIPPDEAADTVQEALIGLWRSSERIPADEAEARAYCLKALRNCCVSALRRHRENESLEAATQYEASIPDRTEYSDTRRRIETLISSLPPGQRDVMRMSCFGDMDCDEISRATGQTEVNVRQLLSRGRRRLRELMKNL